MESQPQNPEFRNNPENLHPWHRHQITFKVYNRVKGTKLHARIQKVLS